MTITKTLEEIGLTSSEAKIYISLLELGKTSAGPLIDKSELQSSVVYRALHHLSSKGMVSFVMEGKVKKYSASDPSNMIDYIDEKKKNLLDIIPELNSKQSQTKKPEVQFFNGDKGIKELLYKLINPLTEQYFPSILGNKKQHGAHTPTDCDLNFQLLSWFLLCVFLGGSHLGVTMRFHVVKLCEPPQQS